LAISNPAGTGAEYGRTCSRITERLIKLLAWRQQWLSATENGQYNLVLPLFTSLFASFDEICGTAMNFVFLSSR